MRSDLARADRTTLVDAGLRRAALFTAAASGAALGRVYASALERT